MCLYDLNAHYNNIWFSRSGEKLKGLNIIFDYNYYKKFASNVICDATFIANEGSDNIQIYHDENGASAFYGNGSGIRRVGENVCDDLLVTDQINR